MKTQDIFVAHPQTSEQASALKAFLQALKIKFEVAKEGTYNPEFIAKIKKSRQDYEDGKFVTVEKENFKSFLGIE
jgi:adenylate kinase family enzyme